LFHEIGHVVHRHSLRAYLEASGVIAIYTWVTGDLEGVSSIILAAPVILIQAGYSRKHEWEADTYALDKMIENDIDPVLFSRIMCKLDAADEKSSEQKSSAGKKGEEKSPSKINICAELVPDAAGPAKKQADAAAPETEDKKRPDNLAFDLLDYLSTHPTSEKRVQRFIDHSKTIKPVPAL
jgi:Zn-dependent protease with chaperone function